MADTVNPSGFNRDKPRSQQSGAGSPNCSTVKRTAGASAPVCTLCRNPYNTEAAHYPTFIVYQDPRERVICTPCAESIRDALL